MQPLKGLKVVDFSKVLAGPLCAQYLGDLGADVIKVEPYVDGDDTRRWPPFRGQDGTVFLSANRNKRSIALDLKRTEGQAVAQRLLARADIAVESFGPGVAKRLGIDYTRAAAANPALVYCSISGFGPVGPLADGKGYDVILQAFGGMMSITGEPDGPPSRSPFSPVDQATGFHAVTGILAALLERARTGKGALVETSLFDSAIGFMGYYFQAYWERGTEPARCGSGHESLCPYQAFEASDRPILLGVANDGLWRKFCRLAGLDDIADDPRFRTNADRVRNREATVAIVAAAMRTRTRDEWITLLREAGIPSSPINSFGDVMAHPHTKASGMIGVVEHRAYGEVKSVLQPIRFDGDRNPPRSPPPQHGEHTRAILREAGYDDAEIGKLVGDRVAFAGDPA